MEDHPLDETEEEQQRADHEPERVRALSPAAIR